MSTFFSFRYPDCIQILSDTAWLDETGKMLLDHSKVFIVPGLPMAITARGNVRSAIDTLNGMYDFVNSFATFDAAEAMWHFIKRHFKRLGGAGHVEAEFLFAFWSQTDGPQHFFLPLHPHSGVEPFQAHSCGDQVAGGATISWEDLSHLSLTADAVALPSFPRDYGPDVLQAMRKPASVPGQARQYVAMGGKCELVTIDRAGVSKAVLASWDDRIGEPLQPDLKFRRHDSEAIYA